MDQDEKKDEDGRDVRGDEETRTQSNHTLASVGRKAMGSTPSSTVGWGAVVACLGGLLYLSTQVDSKIDDRVDKKLDVVKAVYDEKFANVTEKINQCKKDITDIHDELKSRSNKSSRFDYQGRSK